MSTQAVTLLLAVLAVGAQLAVALAVLAWVASRLWPTVAAWRDRVLGGLGADGLTVAFVVALVATLGSLYLSEVAHFRPCTLCWYQRIAMYPLVPVLGVAAWRRDLGARAAALVLAGGGAAVSVYHVLVERYPSLESSACDPTNPCTLIWVKRLGYLTIPTMALSAFALIGALLLHARPDPDDDEDHEEADAHVEPGAASRPRRDRVHP